MMMMMMATTTRDVDRVTPASGCRQSNANNLGGLGLLSKDGLSLATATFVVHSLLFFVSMMDGVGVF